jgi:hypothetical protein
MMLSTSKILLIGPVEAVAAKKTIVKTGPVSPGRVLVAVTHSDCWQPPVRYSDPGCAAAGCDLIGGKERVANRSAKAAGQLSSDLLAHNGGDHTEDLDLLKVKPQRCHAGIRGLQTQLPGFSVAAC